MISWKQYTPAKTVNEKPLDKPVKVCHNTQYTSAMKESVSHERRSESRRRSSMSSLRLDCAGSLV
ncbi:MAG: hypothetical protein LBI19_08475 [Oscillospiraceae bacterium]|nr:hypothetical protein [Oscillospiraceae bacterium]